MAPNTARGVRVLNTYTHGVYTSGKTKTGCNELKASFTPVPIIALAGKAAFVEEEGLKDAALVETG